MDLTDSQTVVTVVAGLAILAGLAGVVVPGLPALPLCWGGVLLWAVFGGAGLGGWAVFAAATVVAAGGAVIKYAWPGRNLKRTGVPTSTLLAGGVLGIVGFFVVPVVGLVLGFVGRGVGGRTAAAGQQPARLAVHRAGPEGRRPVDAGGVPGRPAGRGPLGSRPPPDLTHRPCSAICMLSRQHHAISTRAGNRERKPLDHEGGSGARGTFRVRRSAVREREACPAPPGRAVRAPGVGPDRAWSLVQDAGRGGRTATQLARRR